MTARWLNVKSLLLACLAADAAILAGWVFAEQQEFTQLLLGRQAPVLGVGFLFAFLLTTILAALLLRRRTALAQSTEAKFRSLLDAAPDPMVIMDGDGRITLVNARAEHLFGYRRDELVGKSVDDLMKQASGRINLDNSLSSCHVGTPPEAPEPDLLAVRKDGSRVPVEIRFSPLETDEGTLTISIIRDITERRHAEWLRASRNAIRRVLAEGAAHGGVTPRLLEALGRTLGLDLVVLWTVDAMDNLLRLGQLWHGPEVAGSSYQLAAGSMTYAPGAGLPGRVWAGGEAAWVDVRTTDDDAGWRAATCQGLHQAFAFPVLSETQVLGVVVCFARELPRSDEAFLETLHSIGSQMGRFLKHKQAEEAVHASEARKAAILESALDPIITIDGEGKVLEFNPAAERIFGYARTDAIGREIAALVVPPASRDAFEKNLRASLEPGGESGGRWVKLTLKRADDKEVPVELVLTRIRADGRPLFTCYLRDLTERVEAEKALRTTEEQLRQAQKMEAVGRLAGGVAHDFNNLLTVINGYTQSLLSKLPADTPPRWPIEQISKAGYRAAVLTRQLLAFSRRQVLEPKVFDLNGVLVDLSKMLQRVIGEDIQVAIMAAPDLKAIKADQNRIEHVIMNLVVNARDAMPQGGKLTFETRNTTLDDSYARTSPEVTPGPYVMLAISDTGCGMDEAVRSRIFEPFFTTKEVGKGTGLGLATAYGIIKQSGGHIACYSEVGHGTTFKVYLPISEEKVALAMPSPRAVPTPKGKGTVLLVEDEDMVRTLSKEILQENGYAVLEARHGQEALELSEKAMDSILLTVTDVVMPEMNGRDLAQRLLRRKPDMRVLYVSGYTDNAVIRNGLLEPGTMFLEKPFSPECLVRKVREVLSA